MERKKLPEADDPPIKRRACPPGRGGLKALYDKAVKEDGHQGVRPIKYSPPIPAGGQTNHHYPTPYTRRQVELLVAYGMTRECIAHVMNISTATLYANYRTELAYGKEIQNAAMAERIYHQALYGTGKESAALAMFWMKTRGGWKESMNVGVFDGNADGSAVAAARELTFEERAIRLAQILNRRRIEGGGSIVGEREGAVVTESRAADSSVLQSG
jgi:hypothetical protein